MATNVSNSQPTLAFPSVDSKLSALENVITPGRFLAENIGKEVVVRLKDGREYTGTLISYDSYYNLRLKNSHREVQRGQVRFVVVKGHVYTVHQRAPGLYNLSKDE